MTIKLFDPYLDCQVIEAAQCIVHKKEKGWVIYKPRVGQVTSCYHRKTMYEVEKFLRHQINKNEFAKRAAWKTQNEQKISDGKAGG